jgi:hypothetical protein
VSTTPDPSGISEYLTAHRCDDGCNVAYCHECGEDYTDPCEGHRSFGHVRSFDPYGDDVDCHACCPICGTGVLSPAPEEPTEPRQVVVTLVFSVFTNETDDEFAERFLCFVEGQDGIRTMRDGSLVLP